MQTNHSSDFERLALIAPLLRALKEEGYSEPTPVQAAAIPKILEGEDLIATAKTGTGKTAAFALPILQMLHEGGGGDGVLRGLVLTPTRELALQIHQSFQIYGRHLKLTHAVVVGGVPAGPQIKAMRRRPDILVATPGRLLDLMSQGVVRLRDIEIAVLDEADRMLDMGFLRDVQRIVDALPRHRQTLLFSATMSREISALAQRMLNKPSKVEVTPPATVADNITHKVLFVEQSDKRDLLARLMKDDPDIRSALVFTRTKHRANRVARHLNQAGIGADAIHSDKSQGARQRALDSFHRGAVRVLVATDIMARGIDVDGITHVINFEIPNEAESYVHRIGRTARAGAAGIALSFCNTEELAYLAGIERLTGVTLDEVEAHPHRSASIAALRHAPAQGGATASSKNGGGNGRNGNRRGDGRRGRPSSGPNTAGNGGQRRRRAPRTGATETRGGNKRMARNGASSVTSATVERAPDSGSGRRATTPSPQNSAREPTFGRRARRA